MLTETRLSIKLYTCIDHVKCKNPIKYVQDIKKMLSDSNIAGRLTYRRHRHLAVMGHLFDVPRII